ncbi:hypothetical protein T02_7365 [Trichinella nativa]|uniref:Uncharacterized protein n=1 Tax=Trichinella nativa TaxID=6335 RepID=A0A0V1KIZ4_9BILA|nr:hypothetical protein T02_7365 [Trichinella nativa]
MIIKVSDFWKIASSEIYPTIVHFTQILLNIQVCAREFFHR